MPVISAVLEVGPHCRVTNNDANELKHMFAGEIISNLMMVNRYKKKLEIQVDPTEIVISVGIENTTVCILKGWELFIFGRNYESCLRSMSKVYNKLRASFPNTVMIGIDMYTEHKSRLRRFIEKILLSLVVAIVGLVGSLSPIYVDSLPLHLGIGLPLSISILASSLVAWYYWTRT